jgi:hypothetical protein
MTPSQGYPLVFWRLLPEYTVTPDALPPETVMITWALPALLALNATTMLGGTSEICVPARFDVIGRCNGQPIYARPPPLRGREGGVAGEGRSWAHAQAPVSSLSFKAARKPINARSETIAKSGMFKAVFKKRRCLAPAMAYYEWMDGPEGKVPFAVARLDGDPVAFGGIWEDDPGAVRRDA